MLHGREIFFQNIDVDDVIDIVRKKANSLPKEDDCRFMRPSYKTKGDTQRFDWSMGPSWIFLNDKGNRLGHGAMNTLK